MSRNKFKNIFLDDPLGLLQITAVEEKNARTPSDQRLIDSFEEINSFYEKRTEDGQCY